MTVVKPGAAFRNVFDEDCRDQVTVLPIFDQRYEHDVADLADRVALALTDFPELAGEQITIALDQPDMDRTAAAWPISRIVLVPRAQYLTNVTIYHELGHLAIRVLDERGTDVPTTSEPYCSIFSMARMPADRVDEQRIPYLEDPTAPEEVLPEICERALEYREEHHDYIAQCNRWLTGADAL